MSSTRRNDFALGIVLALFSSNMCLLLLSWHGVAAGLVGIGMVPEMTVVDSMGDTVESLVVTYLLPYQDAIRGVTMAWLTWCILTFPSGDKGDDTKPRQTSGQASTSKRAIFFLTFLVVGVSFLPNVLHPYRHAHPAIRRSLLLSTPSMPPPASSDSASSPSSEPRTPTQDYAFQVYQMTCGGCGSYVRDLLVNMDTIDQATVEWRSGYVTVSTQGPATTQWYTAEWQQKVSTVLTAEGYPVHFFD